VNLRLSAADYVLKYPDLYSSALSSMNLRRGSTASPIKTVKISSSDGIVDAHLQDVRFAGIHGCSKAARDSFLPNLCNADCEILLRGGQHAVEQSVARGDLFAGPIFTGDEWRVRRSSSFMTARLLFETRHSWQKL